MRSTTLPVSACAIIRSLQTSSSTGSRKWFDSLHPLEAGATDVDRLVGKYPLPIHANPSFSLFKRLGGRFTPKSRPFWHRVEKVGLNPIPEVEAADTR